MENRRRAKRTRVAVRGHIRAHGKRVRAQIRNLSERGALILSDMPLMEGGEIELDFNLKPNPLSDLINPFKTVGIVVWCNEDMDCGYQSGINFDPIDPQSRERLVKFLKSVAN